MVVEQEPRMCNNCGETVNSWYELRDEDGWTLDPPAILCGPCLEKIKETGDEEDTDTDHEDL